MINPLKILFVRHGESIANVDSAVHQTYPDHAIPLTELGVIQAQEAGEVIKRYRQQQLGKNKELASAYPIRLWQSPYLRARQTTAEILKANWDGESIITDVKEDVCLVEQQFGIFDGLSDEQLAEKFPKEFANIEKCEKFNGRFWAQLLLGESRFDVAIRVQQIFSAWIRDYEQQSIDTIVVVSHGVAIRAMIMRWLNLPWEWVEREPNPANGSVRLIEGTQDKGWLT